MTAWFADSFFFLALLIREDARHERAVTTLKTLQTDVITTSWILTEVADALCSVRSRGGFKRLLAVLDSNPRVTIVPADQSLFNLGVELYNSRPDKEWSLTDCISFVVMQEQGITEALTGDRHFEQAGFTALLK
jgi:uncharacterized protein